MKLKKFVLLCMVMVCCTGLFACGCSNEDNNNNGTNDNGTDMIDDIENDLDNNNNKNDNNNNDNNDNNNDSTNGTSKKDISLSDIHNEVKQAYGEEYLPNMQYDDVFIEDTLGLSEDDYDEIIAEGSLVSVNVDTFIAVKAKEGKGDAVADKIEAYRDYLVNDAMMYPANEEKIKASKYIRHGDYVFFTCLGKVDAYNQDLSDEDIRKEAEEKNQKAEDTINGFFE